MKYERITAADVRPGDYVARAKTHPFNQVTRVDAAGVSVWIYLDLGERGQTRIRPRLSASLWRRVPGFVASQGEAFDLWNEDGTYCTRVVALEATPGEVGPGHVLLVANPDVNFTAGVPVSRLVRRGD